MKRTVIVTKEELPARETLFPEKLRGANELLKRAGLIDRDS